MISLKNTFLINNGTNRACFKNPIDPNQCIKITISGNNKETLNEIKYYQILEEKDSSFEMISKYFGTIETSKGKGYIFELIKDYNGNISKEVDKYINEGNNKVLEEILGLLPSLKKYLKDERIYVKDLNTVNIVFQKINEKESRLVIIDGLAHSNYNPLFYRINYFINKKIEKSWAKLFNSIYNRDIIQKNLSFKSKLDKLN